MHDLDEEVPPPVARALGHICGALFVLLSLFSLWSLYRYYLNHNHPILIVAGICFGLAAYFLKTAVRLTADRKR